jgi:two-component system, LytTR family, sensor kinase
MTITKIRRIELYVAFFFIILVFFLDFQTNYENVIRVLSEISTKEEIKIGYLFDLWQNIFFPLLSIYIATLGCWLLLHYYTIPKCFARKNIPKTIALLLLSLGILVLGVYLYFEFYKILRFRYDYKQIENLRTMIGAKVMPIFRIKHWIETTATIAFYIVIGEILSQVFYHYYKKNNTSDDGRTKVYYETALFSWLGFSLMMCNSLLENTDYSGFYNYNSINYYPRFSFIYPTVQLFQAVILHSWAYHLIFFKDKESREIKNWLKIAFSGFVGLFILRTLFGGSYSDWPVDFFIIPIVALATAAARYLYARPKTIIDRLTRKLTQNQAELSSLKAQINPHFLFNAMNTLYATAIEERAEQTTKGIHQLSEMMRFMMNENNQDQIDIQSEVQYLRNYIDLQRLRFVESDKFELKVELDDSLCLHAIAPMLLVPFVENAFKHGISLRKESWIYVKLHCQNQRLLFSVFNSLHQRQDNDPEKYSSGIGLVNVKKRLELLYAKTHSLTIHRTEKEFSVVLEIDFRSKQSKIDSALGFYKN